MKTTDFRIVLSGIVSFIALGFAGPAHAACSSPAGNAGDQFYNTTSNTMQFCNGTGWVNAGTFGGLVSETDPQVGTLTSGRWCTTDGTDIDCTANVPLTSESDPKVGTLTATKWCTTDGAAINCTSDAPVTTESDPQVGNANAGKWCRGTSTQVECDQNTPGGFVLLDSGTVTNAATLDITLPSGHRSYKILIQNIVPSTDVVALLLRTSSNGGSSYDSGASDYKWVEKYTGVGPGGGEFDGMGSDTADAHILLGGNYGNGTNENGGLEIDLVNPTGGGVKLVKASVVKFQEGANLVYTDGAGARMNTSAINAVRFLFDSGNIAAADWALYGYPGEAGNGGGGGGGGSCAGAEVGGYCWYLDSVGGESCDTVCASHGGCDLTGTKDYAGSGGSDANCEAVLDALGVAEGSVFAFGFDGFGCASGEGLRVRDTATTTCGATDEIYRACACNE